MPIRPRSHQLEEESERAFKQILPSRWVPRRPAPDYGVDLQVEVVSEDNKVTGRSFNVQLKATDSHILKRALTVSLKLEHWDYYHAHDLPTLIVRYHSPSRKLYAKWFHSFDPYYACIGKTTASLHLDPTDELTADNVQRLAEDLNVFQRYRSPNIELPVSFRLEIKEQLVYGIPAAQIASGIRKIASSLSGFILITEITAPLCPYIQISNQKTVVSLAGMASFSLHTGGLALSNNNMETFFHDILLGIAIAFSQIGHLNVAAQISLTASKSSSLISDPNIAVMVANWMVKTHRIIEALQISELLFQKKEHRLASDIFMVNAFQKEGTLTASEASFFEEFMNRRIQQSGLIGNDRLLATAHYNLGNHYRATRGLLMAFHHYRQAAKHDSDYLKRNYFWLETAGILFEKGHYQLSTRFYEQAIKLGEENSCHPLHADALMFSGRYKESEIVFADYFKQNSEIDPEWRLKKLALQIIQDNLGLKQQHRMIKNAVKLIPRGTEVSEPDACEKKLDEALTQDALCGLAWFNMGVLKNLKGEKREAFISFFMAAITTRWDVEAWCNAITLGMFLDDFRNIVPFLLRTAYKINEEALMKQMFKFTETQHPEFPKIEFLNMINEFVSQLPKGKESFILRIIGKGPDYKKIKIP